MRSFRATALALVAMSLCALATTAGAADRSVAAQVGDISLPCLREFGCVTRTDREVHPFEGSLGRPCGYRTRETPSGPRKVRVCY